MALRERCILAARWWASEKGRRRPVVTLDIAWAHYWALHGENLDKLLDVPTLYFICLPPPISWALACVLTESLSNPIEISAFDAYRSLSRAPFGVLGCFLGGGRYTLQQYGTALSPKPYTR